MILRKEDEETDSRFSVSSNIFVGAEIFQRRSYYADFQFSFIFVCMFEFEFY